MSKVISTFETPANTSDEDNLFGQLIARGMHIIPAGDLKEDLKIEIQQLINRTQKQAESI